MEATFIDSKDDIVFNIGRQLRRLRQKRLMSQSYLSEETGLHLSYVCRLEEGKRVPSLETLLKLADALKLRDWRELLAYDG